LRTPWQSHGGIQMNYLKLFVTGFIIVVSGAFPGGTSSLAADSRMNGITIECEFLGTGKRPLRCQTEAVLCEVGQRTSSDECRQWLSVFCDGTRIFDGQLELTDAEGGVILEGIPSTWYPKPVSIFIKEPAPDRMLEAVLRTFNQQAHGACRIRVADQQS